MWHWKKNYNLFHNFHLRFGNHRYEWVERHVLYGDKIYGPQSLQKQCRGREPWKRTQTYQAFSVCHWQTYYTRCCRESPFDLFDWRILLSLLLRLPHLFPTFLIKSSDLYCVPIAMQLACHGVESDVIFAICWFYQDTRRDIDPA